jgi:hypothetical protein
MRVPDLSQAMADRRVSPRQIGAAGRLHADVPHEQPTDLTRADVRPALTSLLLATLLALAFAVFLASPPA